jgi:hypothetical protein
VKTADFRCLETRAKDGRKEPIGQLWIIIVRKEVHFKRPSRVKAKTISPIKYGNSRQHEGAGTTRTLESGVTGFMSWLLRYGRWQSASES